MSGHDRAEEGLVQGARDRVVRLPEVEDDDAPPGREDAAHLAKGGERVGDVSKAVTHRHGVEGAVRERKTESVSLRESAPAARLRGGAAPRRRAWEA